MRPAKEIIKDLRNYPAHYTAAHEAADKLDHQLVVIEQLQSREKYLKRRIERLKKKLNDDTPEVIDAA